MTNPRLALRNARGNRFVIQHAQVTIGRDPRNDVVINGDSVSRHHALMRASDDSVEIRDEGSANGTYLNGHRLEQPARLSIGDELRIGQERFTVEAYTHATVVDASAPPQPPVAYPPVYPARPGGPARAGVRKSGLVPALAIGALVVIAAVTVTLFLNRPLQPDQAARGWVNALASQDVSQLSNLTCMSQQSAVQATSLVFAAGGLFGTTLDTGSLEYATTRSDGNVADVQVTGSAKVSIGPISSARRVNLNMRMRQEGGKWRYCDDISRLASQFR